MDDVNISDVAVQPDVPVEFVPASGGEIIKLGPVILRVMEDGSHTDMRISVGEFVLPPQTPGPPGHYHLMHDETFLVTKGTVRFHKHGSGKEEAVDAKVGDYIVVPVNAPHTFSNPFDEEARFVNTFTPAFYINYFKLMATMTKEGKPVTPAINKAAMSYYATIPADLAK